MIPWGELGRHFDEARAASGRIILATHVNADGDGLGSQAGLWHFLKHRGHDAHMINTDTVPERYGFIDGVESIAVYDQKRHRDMIRGAHLFIVLDNSSPERLGTLLPDVRESTAFRICIDHHVTVDPFWQLNCIDTDAAASGQLVYEAIKALGGAITAPIAIALYAAFVTDTGHFRFPKTTPHVHRIIAELMEAGAINPQRIYRAIYEGHSRALSRIVGHALSDAHYDYGGRFAWARLTRRQLEECGGFEEDTGDLVNMLLAVKGVEAAALFKEMPEGLTKVSLRSLGDVDVNLLASRFGGGGHRNASGVLMTAPLEEGVRSIVEGMKETLGEPSVKPLGTR